ncbi:hypothetical protein [Candidatus Kuenenia stuttgartiensis]|nr:hypothetical protein [Candidatus Kuenenia stuttgartiensis]
MRPSIKTNANAGVSVIDTKDWPADYTDALLQDELIAIEHEDGTVTEYTVQSDYNSDSNGEILSLSISPALSHNVIADEPIRVPNRRKMSAAMRTAVSAESSVIAHFMEYQFSGGSVLINTSTHNIPMMNPDLGIPRVNGASQTGTSLVTDGWIKKARVFRHGDKFTLDGVEYTCDVGSTEVSVEDCENLWTEFNKTKADVVITNSSVYKKQGTYSIKMVVDTSVKKRKLIGYKDLASAQDISKYESVKFWVRSDVATNAGDFKLVFSTKKVCKNPIEYIPFPALEANTWAEVDAEFYDNEVLTGIKSVGVIVFGNLSAQTSIWIDDIRVYTEWVKTNASGQATIKVTPSLSPSPANDALLLRTWVGWGGHLNFEQIDESSDLKANRMTAIFSGVDQSILQILLTQHYLGRYAKIYRAHFSGGAMISEPLLMYWGYMNGGFRVSEKRGEDVEDDTRTVEIQADLQDKISTLNTPRGIQTNPSSLQAYFPDDGGFDGVAELVEKIVPWGKMEKAGGGGLCVLATACLKFKGLPDNCKELEVLRRFRDEYLAKTPEGQQLINGYYRIVNRLVREIEECRTDLYEKIYKDIKEAVQYIEAREYDKAVKKYYDIINPLKEEFL